MIKRITKFTGLLVCAACVVSIMPAYAADIQKLDPLDGTIYSAKAKGNGIFVDGEVNGEDEAVYWISDDGKYNKLDVETGSSLKDLLFNKYLEIDTRSSDYTYIDITDGFKQVDYDVREDLDATVARTLKGKIRHDNDNRFEEDTFDNADFTNYYYNTYYNKGGNNFLGASNGFSNFVLPLKEKRLNGETVSTVYSDSTGAYVDADYNLGSVKIFEDSTTGAAVTIKNTQDNYKLNIDDTLYDLKANIKEKNELYDSGDNVYRLADLTLYAKPHGSDDPYKLVNTSKDDDSNIKLDLKFGGKVPVNGKTTVLQKFSKTQSTDAVDGIKYSKSSDIYFIADEDGNQEYLLGNPNKTDILQRISDVDVSNNKGTGSTKITGNDKYTCSVYLDTTNNKIYAETLTLKHKNSFNYVDLSDSDSSDIDSVASGINNSGGAPWFVNDGYIMTWDGDHSFIKTNRIDSGLSSISTGSKTKIITWNDDKDIYSIINIPKAATTSGTSTTATTTGAAVTVDGTAKNGWTQNNDSTWSYIENGTNKTGWLKDSDTWYYLKLDGIMATAWIKDNGIWYYLDPSGAMRTGWINDNGTWYYCDPSGAMLYNTTIDGYTLGSDGAWIQ